MYATIRDPNIAKGFSILANVFGPQDPKQLIQADLYRGRRDQMAAETAKVQAELTDIRNAQAYQAMLADVLSDPAWMETPEGRAKAASMLPYLKDGMQHGPGFLTGTSVFTQPNFMDPNSLSNVLIGTGVVNGWKDTPAGHQYEVDHGHTAGSTPLDVSPTDMGGLQNMTEARLQAKYGNLTIDPEVFAAIMPRVAESYQRSRNAEAAVAEAINAVPLEPYDNSWWPTGNTNLRLATPPAGVPAPADKAAAGGAPTPAAVPVDPASPKPEGTIGYTRDGRKVQKINGRWVPI